jgi:hypothetical protein
MCGGLRIGVQTTRIEGRGGVDQILCVDCEGADPAAQPGLIVRSYSGK